MTHSKKSESDPSHPDVPKQKYYVGKEEIHFREVSRRVLSARARLALPPSFRLFSRLVMLKRLIFHPFSTFTT